MTHALLAPMLFGVKWLDPEWMLAQFGSGFFWVSLAIIVVECGLFFPFLPGDTLLVAIGLFLAGDKLSIVPGPRLLDLAVVLPAAGGCRDPRQRAGLRDRQQGWAQSSTSTTARSSSGTTSTAPRPSSTGTAARRW